MSMRLRDGTWLLVGLAVLCTGLCAEALAKNPRESDVVAHVDRYVIGDSEFRGDVLGALRRVDPRLAQRRLLEHLENENTRGSALELAAELGVPGLFKHARAYLDGIHEDKVVDLLLKTQEKGAVGALYDRWTAVELDSTSYMHLKNGLMSHPIHAPNHLIWLKNQLRVLDGQRREDVAVVLAYQLGLEDAAPEAVLESWSKAFAELKRDGTGFSRRGTSLLKAATSSSRNIRRVGGNFRVGANGGRLALRPLPEKLQEGGWTIRVRLKIKSGTGGRVCLEMDDRHSWCAQMKDGEWVVKEHFGAEEHIRAKSNRWTEVEFRWDDESTSSRRYMRRVTVRVDGKILLNRGQLNGRLTALYFVADDGDMIVSNAEYRP